MRVLHIMWSAEIGGIQKIVFDLIHHQKESKELYNEILLCKDEGAYKDLYANDNIKCISVGMENGSDISIDKYRKLKKIFSAFDILHFHSYNPFVCMAAKKSGKKIIFTEHGNFGFGRNKSIIDRLTMKLQKRFLNSGIDGITFNSQFTKRTSEKRFGLKKIKREVVYNGIPENNFEGISLKEIDPWVKEKITGKFVVGTSARFAEVKRIDRLIETFSEFCREKKCVLLLCGDGPLRLFYEKMIDKLNISDKVIITGFLSPIRNYQAHFNVAVLPSSNEAFGIVAVETLSLGIPTIVFSDGGGLIEIVGTLLKDDVVENKNQLLNRMNYYYQNNKMTEQDKQKRIQHAGKFTIADMSAKIFRIYKNAISDVRN